MTLFREPLTFEDALWKISKVLGWDGCAAVIGKSESHVRKLGTPDTERELLLNHALRLDAAHRRAGGKGAPLLECYAAKLGLAAPAEPANSDMLLNGAAIAAKENGEAVAAIIALAARMEDPSARIEATREIKEAISHLTRILNKITATGSEEHP